MIKENKLANEEWVIEYISTWLERNTPFKVESITLKKDEKS